MKINILNCFALGSLLLLAAACNDSVSDLLESKVYFEMKETTVKVQDDASTVQLDLAARISSLVSTEVDVTYSIADKNAVYVITENSIQGISSKGENLGTQIFEREPYGIVNARDKMVLYGSHVDLLRLVPPPKETEEHSKTIPSNVESG